MVSRPVARYRSSRRYFLLALAAFVGAAVSGWAGFRWSADGWHYVSFTIATLFVLSGGAILALAARPDIEIHETHLVVGRRSFPWVDIRSVDQTNWISPLALRIGLVGDHQFLLVYAGDPESAHALVRNIRRYSRYATLDGVPFRQFWGDVVTAQPVEPNPLRYPILRPEDEQEVERMFRQLKAAGKIDQHAPDEKIGEK